VVVVAVVVPTLQPELFQKTHGRVFMRFFSWCIHDAILGEFMLVKDSDELLSLS
jgi:hypothetical protein